MANRPNLQQTDIRDHWEVSLCPIISYSRSKKKNMKKTTRLSKAEKKKRKKMKKKQKAKKASSSFFFFTPVRARESRHKRLDFWKHLKGLPLEKRTPFLLLQIYSMFYLTYEYACLRLDIPLIFWPKRPSAPPSRRPLHGHYRHQI